MCTDNHSLVQLLVLNCASHWCNGAMHLVPPLPPQGTVLLSHSYQQTEDSRSCWKFTADVFLLHHNGSSLRQATVFVASTMQAATIRTEEEVRRM